MGIRPKAPIRRFDVFAEYTRLEKLHEGVPDDVAKGYAIWLAKVVAARKFGRLKPHEMKRVAEAPGVIVEEARKFRSLGGVEQTDKVFEHEIVERMGSDFYDKVFSPAIRLAFEQGKSYRQIRDSIRTDWKV